MATITITKQTSTVNTTALANRDIKYIVVHYTAGVTSKAGSAANIATWFASGSASASSDYIVDDESIIQYNPDIANRYTWHCGGNKYATQGGDYYGICTNKNAIGIEVCSTNDTGKMTEANDSHWSFTDSVINVAVGLVKYLMNKYGIDSEHVIRHYDVTGKQCVPTYSEVLTKDGWKSIADVEIGEEIACADIDNLSISFEEVYDKVPIKTQDTYTCNGFTATKNHRMVYSYDKTRDFYRIESYGTLLGKSGIYIPLAGHSDLEGLPLTNEMIAFYIAVQADGHYMYEKNKAGEKRYYGVEFHFKKQRKIERLIEILNAIKLDYSLGNRSDGSTAIRIYNSNGTNIVCDICEKYLKEKVFTWEWLSLSKGQAEFFLKEIQNWDGCVAGNLYTSKVQQNLDIVSAIASLNGIGSNVCGSNVCFRESPYMTIGRTVEIKRNSGKNRHTEVTCVSVKTGVFICRQNGKVFVIGNCPGVVGWNADSGDESAWLAFKRRIGGAVSTETATAETQLYYVQVGAFALEGNAKLYLDAVKAVYPDAFVKSADSMYYVQVGAFASYGNAMNYLDTVKSDYPNAFIKIM